jgi:hypothetical protein
MSETPEELRAGIREPMDPAEFLARFDEIAKAIDRAAGLLVESIDKGADAVLQYLDYQRSKE